MGELKHSPHFSVAEMACQCGCHKMGVKPELIDALEKLRSALGDRPIIVNSGFRCAKHPVEAAKVHPGYHNKGIAADIRVKGMTPRGIYAVARTLPEFKGFGVDDEQGYIHLDLRPEPARWTYTKGRTAPWREA